MKRTGIYGLVVVTAFIFSVVVMAASASAVICARVDEPGTGNKSRGCIINEGATQNEYILVTGIVRNAGYAPYLYCAYVEVEKTGNKSNNQCNVARAMGEWILVKEVFLAFIPGGGVFPVAFTAKSGTSTLTGDAGVDTATCTSSSGAGEISGVSEIGSLLLHFTGCTSSGASKSGCAARSTNTSNSGLILTNTLHAVLGLILPKPASGSDVGLLLLPLSGKKFYTLAGNECTTETAVTGSVAGVVEPIDVSQRTGKLTLGVTSGKQNITKLDIVENLTEPELVAWTTTATDSASDEVSYTEAVEVT